MAVKVSMKRVPKSGAWRELNGLLRELRILAMEQPGYISGETLLSAKSQGTTLVLSVWDNVKHWNDYQDSPHRQAILDRMEHVLEVPADTEVWVESPVIG